MTFGERLRSLREQKGLTQKKLAKMLSLGESTISFYEKGKRKPAYEILQRMAKIFGVTTDYLLGATDHVIPDSYPINEFAVVPVYGEIRAGKPALVRDEIIDWIPISAEQIKGGEYFYLRVKGDSMKDEKIFDGDYVLVRLQPTLENGKIGIIGIIGDSAVEYGSEATIKKFYRKGNIAVLQPANPEYDPIIVPIKDVHIIGEVVKTERWVNGRHIR